MWPASAAEPACVLLRLELRLQRLAWSVSRAGLNETIAREEVAISHPFSCLNVFRSTSRPSATNQSSTRANRANHNTSPSAATGGRPTAESHHPQPRCELVLHYRTRTSARGDRPISSAEIIS